MAKIDVSKIDGYADMSTEDKLAALEGYELPEADYTGWVKKETFDKTASEAAKYKKDASANNGELEQLRSDVAALKKERTVSQYTAKLIAQGYSEALAAETAAAMESGDMEKVFANQTTFLSERDKRVKQEALKGTPAPVGGNANASQTIDYQKEIDKAMAAGDMPRAAALMRMQQEQNK